MTKIPQNVRKEIQNDLSYRVCALKGLHGHICGGRITMEHALIYAGRQIQKKWAIIPVCAAGQEVDHYQDAHTMNKELNVWIALNFASDIDLAEFPRANYSILRDRLNKKYGVYIKIVPSHIESEINYDLIDTKYIVNIYAN